MARPWKGNDVGEEEIYRDYDDFAWFYNRYWGNVTALSPMREVVERLIQNRLPPAAKILDLCCGTGQFDHMLAGRGFVVTGVDGSGQQLEYAAGNAPECEFIHADARSFNLPAVFEGAICIYDSLNHVLSLRGLSSAFENVFNALVPGGLFLFDLNMEVGFLRRWKGSNSMVGEDNALIMMLNYDEEEKIARADVTMFRQEGGTWRRSDLSLYQKAYAEEEVSGSLERCGFTAISTCEAIEELGMPMGEGRTFFLARKP